MSKRLQESQRLQFEHKITMERDSERERELRCTSQEREGWIDLRKGLREDWTISYARLAGIIMGSI